jgi:hypothetical protein
VAATRPGPAEFVAPGRTTRALVIALGASAAAAWVVLAGLYTFFERVWRGLGNDFAGQSLQAHWAQVEISRRVQGGVWLVTAILFLAWLHRVYGNLRVLGAVRLRFSPRWAVTTFFVPVLHLLWPFLVMREIWTASDPSATDDPQPPPGATSPWVGWWWGCFVTASVLDPGFWRLVEDTSARFAMGAPTLILVVAQLAEIAAAVLGIVVVLRVDARQARAFAATERALGPG